MREIAIASSRRTDDQLRFMMDQTAEWTVNGRAGVALGSYGSLREALRAVFRYEADGVHVFAVCRHPRDDIVVFREQVGRLADADDGIGDALRRTEAAWSAATGAPMHRRVPADSVLAARSRLPTRTTV
jgi:hypothetical protein